MTTFRTIWTLKCIQWIMEVFARLDTQRCALPMQIFCNHNFNIIYITFRIVRFLSASIGPNQYARRIKWNLAQLSNRLQFNFNCPLLCVSIRNYFNSPKIGVYFRIRLSKQRHKFYWNWKCERWPIKQYNKINVKVKIVLGIEADGVSVNSCLIIASAYW